MGTAPSSDSRGEQKNKSSGEIKPTSSEARDSSSTSSQSTNKDAGTPPQIEGRSPTQEFDALGAPPASSKRDGGSEGNIADLVLAVREKLAAGESQRGSLPKDDQQVSALLKEIAASLAAIKENTASANKPEKQDKPEELVKRIKHLATATIKDLKDEEKTTIESFRFPPYPETKGSIPRPEPGQPEYDKQLVKYYRSAESDAQTKDIKNYAADLKGMRAIYIPVGVTSSAISLLATGVMVHSYYNGSLLAPTIGSAVVGLVFAEVGFYCSQRMKISAFQLKIEDAFTLAKTSIKAEEMADWLARCFILIRDNPLTFKKLYILDKTDSERTGNSLDYFLGQLQKAARLLLSNTYAQREKSETGSFLVENQYDEVFTGAIFPKLPQLKSRYNWITDAAGECARYCAAITGVGALARGVMEIGVQFFNW